jgi:hypothetical protein
MPPRNATPFPGAHTGTDAGTHPRLPEALPAQRARRARGTLPPVPLGSLTQPGHDEVEPCPACAGTQLTSLSMTLTDGTHVRFTSCRRCEHRRWESEDGELSIGAVLGHTRRTV